MITYEDIQRNLPNVFHWLQEQGVAKPQKFDYEFWGHLLVAMAEVRYDIRETRNDYRIQIFQDGEAIGEVTAPRINGNMVEKRKVRLQALYTALQHCEHVLENRNQENSKNRLLNYLEDNGVRL